MIQASDPLSPSHMVPEVCRAPQGRRQRETGSPARQWAANLTCRLFIRRTSSKKSRDSMARPARGTRAAERARSDQKTERLAHRPGSHWTGPRGARTSASGAGTGSPSPPLPAPPRASLRRADKGTRDSPNLVSRPRLAAGGRSHAGPRLLRTYRSPVCALSPRPLAEAVTRVLREAALQPPEGGLSRTPGQSGAGLGCPGGRGGP